MQGNSTDLFGNIPTKRCMRCKQQKPASEFPMSVQRRLRTCEACRSLTEKPCTDCKEIKPIDDYAPQKAKNGKTRPGSLCHSCRARRCREWNAKHSRGKLLNGNLLKAFGITLDEFNAMLAVQNGVCYICGLPPENTNARNWRLHVDHCHSCDGLRKLLCSKCNNGLGCFRDNPKLLAKAIEYLRDHDCLTDNGQKSS